MNIEHCIVGVVMLAIGLCLGCFWGEWLKNNNRNKHVSTIDPEKNNLDKDRFDACLDVSKHFYQCFNDRRVYEWKLNFALWAVVVLTTKMCMDTQVSTLSKNILLVAYVIIFLVYVGWTKGHWWANQQDKGNFEYYRTLAENQLFKSERPKQQDTTEPSVWKGVFANWSRRIQIATTFIVLTASWSLIFVGNNTEGKKIPKAEKPATCVDSQPSANNGN